MKDSVRATICVVILGGVFLFSGIFLIWHAWKISRVVQLTEEVQTSLSEREILSQLDLQIEHGKKRLQDLDPGPPPPWFYPSYYYDWLPRARLYSEAQETFQLLRKQKMELLESGKTQATRARSVWNFGIAPILHTLLAITLILTALRCMFRFALWKGLFSWVSLERSSTDLKP